MTNRLEWRCGGNGVMAGYHGQLVWSKTSCWRQGHANHPGDSHSYPRTRWALDRRHLGSTWRLCATRAETAAHRTSLVDPNTPSDHSVSRAGCTGRSGSVGYYFSGLRCRWPALQIERPFGKIWFRYQDHRFTSGDPALINVISIRFYLNWMTKKLNRVNSCVKMQPDSSQFENLSWFLGWL